MQNIITSDFVALLEDQFLLEWKGVHGVSHWARVRRNGADTSVIEYFSFLHDSRRFDENSDPEHGERAAEFALSLRDSSFFLLVTACEGYTHEWQHENVTVQACWEADRLELGRVGNTPDPACMGTEQGPSNYLIECLQWNEIIMSSHCSRLRAAWTVYIDEVTNLYA